MSELHSHCQCDQCSGIDCGQDNPEEFAALEKASEKRKRDQVLDEVHKRLEALTTECELVTCVTWADIDCLFAELKDGGS